MDKNEVHETIADLDKLIDSGKFDEHDVELFKKLRGMVIGRDAVVGKIKAFRSEFERACGLFYEAFEAVNSADDYASEVDARIAKSIDEHLRAADRLCRFGGAVGGKGDGFGEEHLFADNDDYFRFY